MPGSRATLDIKEKMTTAPTYLTESELIGKMEKNGIGTGEYVVVFYFTRTHVRSMLFSPLKKMQVYPHISKIF